MSIFNPLPVEPAFFSWRGHQIASYSAGAGPKVLLLHSINAAASAFEMRKPFVQLQDTFHTHAIDLLGYGRSDRPARTYVAGDYVDLIAHTLQQMGSGTTLIASSLSAAYAVRATRQNSELVQALVLVCPAGIEQLAQPPGAANWIAYRSVRGAPGRLIFGALTTRRAVRFFLEREGYARRSSVTPDTLEGFYQATQHPGARYAPLCFVTGLLNCNIVDDFAALTQPILIVWGRQATTTPVRQADAFLARNSQAKLCVVDNASLLVQDEQPEMFNGLVREFLTVLALEST